MITFQRNGFQVLEKDTFGCRGDLYIYIKGTEEGLTIVSLFVFIKCSGGLSSGVGWNKGKLFWWPQAFPDRSSRRCRGLGQPRDSLPLPKVILEFSQRENFCHSFLNYDRAAPSV